MPPRACTTCGHAIDATDEGTSSRCPSCASPQRIGSYRVEGTVHRGGMGTVHRAVHETLGTRVAIKAIRSDLEHDGEGLRERFLREARLTARIEHPGAVRVHELHSLDDRLYLVMEWIEGETVRQVIERGAVPWRRALAWTLELLEVLAAAHEVFVVHRDVKPENLVIDRAGHLRVLDFGIARARHDDARLTQTGELVGTPEYMAPEQLLEAPEEIDARCDVHAAALTLYEMLTGRSPFAGTNLFQTLKLVESYLPEPPSRQHQELPEELDEVLERALRKDPKERTGSAAEFARELRGVLARSERDGAKRRRTPAGIAFLAATLVGLALGGTVGSWNEDAIPPLVEDSLVARVRQGLDEPSARLLPGELHRFLAATEACENTRDRLLRGRALRRLGRSHAALSELAEARSTGLEEALPDLAVAWHEAHSLPRVVLRDPVWLHVSDFEDLERLLGTTSHEDPIVRAALALASDRVDEVSNLLEGDERRDAAFLRALAHRRLGHVERARSCLQGEETAPSPVPSYAFVAAANPEELARAVSLLDRRSPERHLYELVLAHLRNDARRMRAALELAVLCGTEEDAIELFAALRVANPEASRLRRDEALVLVEELEALRSDSPLRTITLVHLHRFLGEEERAHSLLAEHSGHPSHILEELRTEFGAESTMGLAEVLREGMTLLEGLRLAPARVRLESFLERANAEPVAPELLDRGRQGWLACVLLDEEREPSPERVSEILEALGRSECSEVRRLLDRHDLSRERREWLRTFLEKHESLRNLLPRLLPGAPR